MNLSALLNNNGLKSCMSKKKSVQKKSIVFGSPKAAFYEKDSRAGSFTPLTREEAKAMFPINQEEAEQEPDDSITSQNSKILDDWDRLTNTSGGSESDEDVSVFSSCSSASKSDASRVSGQSPKSRRRRKSMLQV